MQLAPITVTLLALGVVLADESGMRGAVGGIALGQGIGLAVALAWLAVGHNPLSRR
jgi:hypothetical protein